MAETSAVIKLSATDDGATSTIEKVGGAATNSAGSTANLKKELRELQQQLATLDPNSKAFQDLSVRAGEVKDRINDASEAVRANAGNAFEGLSNNASLLGDRLLSLDFEGVSSAAKGLGSNIGRLDFKGLSTGIQQAGGAVLNLGKSLLFNPLFLIPALVIGLIAGLYKLKDSIPLVGAAFEAVGNVISAVTDGIKDFTDWIGLTDFAATEQLENAVGQRDGLLSDLDRQEKRAKAEARKNGRDIVAVEREYAEKRKQIYNSVISAAEAKIARGAQLNEQELKDLQDAKNGIYDIETAEINRAADQQEKAQEDAEKAAEDAARKAEQRAAEAQRKREQAAQKAEQARQQQLEKEKQINDFLEKANEERVKANLDAQEKELLELEKTFNDKLEVVKNNAELTNKLNAEYELQWQAIQDKYDQLELDKEKEKQAALLKIQKDAAAEKQAELDAYEEENFLAGETARSRELIAVRDSYFTKITELENNGLDASNLREEQRLKEQEINDKYDAEDLAKITALNEAKIAAQRALEDAKLAIASGAIDLAKALAGKNEKAANAIFLVEKALAIAQVVISTQREIAGYYSNPTWSLLPDGGLAIKTSMAAAAKIRAGLSIASIVATSISKFKGGGGSAASAGGGGGGGSMGGGLTMVSAAGGGGGGGVAQFNPLNTNFVNNRPNQVSQTYVLAGDVANAQEARNRVQDLARL
jgi:hypothetical protein